MQTSADVRSLGRVTTMRRAVCTLLSALLILTVSESARAQDATLPRSMRTGTYEAHDR